MSRTEEPHQERLTFAALARVQQFVNVSLAVAASMYAQRTGDGDLDIMW